MKQLNTSIKVIYVGLIFTLISCSNSKEPIPDLTPLIQKFATAGHFTETLIEVKDDTGANLYRIYLPENPTAQLAVVIWGNGTGANPADYDGIMRHLAQWGFLVLDNYSENTGTGEEMSEAITYLVHAQSDPTNTLFNQIDLEHIATVGHSQGSTGAINSHTNFENGALVKTVVSIALPALKWADEEDKYDVSKIETSFLVLGGKKDQLISPVSSNKLAIEQTDGIAALCLMVKGVGHNEIQHDGGVYKGILTAWLSYQLKNNAAAELVFKGDNAEIYKSAVIKEIIKKNF